MLLRAILEKDVAATARLRLKQEKGFMHSLAALLAHSGDSWFWLIGLAGLWFLGSREGHGRLALMAIGIVILAGLVMAIKLTIRRRRPEGEWGAIYRITDPHSFPSGHAARAMMLAVVVCGVGPAWAAIVLLIWVPLVSLARVAMGVHYLSDVLAGVVIGSVIGLGILVIQPLLAGWAPFLF